MDCLKWEFALNRETWIFFFDEPFHWPFRMAHSSFNQKTNLTWTRFFHSIGFRSIESMKFEIVYGKLIRSSQLVTRIGMYRETATPNHSLPLMRLYGQFECNFNANAFSCTLRIVVVVSVNKFSFAVYVFKATATKIKTKIYSRTRRTVWHLLELSFSILVFVCAKKIGKNNKRNTKTKNGQQKMRRQHI